MAYNILLKNLNELKSDIKREIKLNKKKELKREILILEKRCDLVIEAKGGHID